MAAAVAVLAPVLGRRFDDPSIVPMLRLSGPLGLVLGIGTVMLYGTQAFRRMRSVALVRNILEPIFRLLFVGVTVLVTRSQVAAF